MGMNSPQISPGHTAAVINIGEGAINVAADASSILSGFAARRQTLDPATTHRLAPAGTGFHPSERGVTRWAIARRDD